MTQMPPTPIEPAPGAAMAPHHGVLILVFGILSWLVCVIFGIVAWVMANSDLRAMQEGRMDPTGEGLTKAGKIVGMISVILSIVGIFIAILVLLLMGIFAAASSGGSGP